MFKKSLLALFLVFSFVITPVAFADTASDLQAQINAILAKIQSLQALINASQGGSTSSVSTQPVISSDSYSASGFCHTFTRYLVAGTRNSEVTALTSALTLEELLDGKADTFDDDIASAVIDFQTKYGIKKTGTVGPLTRAKLNALYGCANKPIPPSTSVIVLSPNGGETWQKGTTQTIKWEDKTPYPPCPGAERGLVCGSDTMVRVPKTYDLKLAPYYPPCAGTTCPTYPHRSSYVIANGILGSSYSWNAGTIIDAYGSGTTAPSGSYTIQICQSVGTPCDSSDSYFKITSGVSTNNNAPKIGPIAVQSNIRVGESVNFNFSATDPDNDDLSWSVDWGENIVRTGACSILRRQTGTGWSYTTSHAWAQPGTYRVKVSVSDCMGGSDDSFATITVSQSGGGGAPIINGLNAPTTLTVGQTGTWTVKAYDPDGTSLNYSVVWGDEKETVSPAAHTLPPPRHSCKTAPSRMRTQLQEFTHRRLRSPM